jgi:hypothetical protein
MSKSNTLEDKNPSRAPISCCAAVPSEPSVVTISASAPPVKGVLVLTQNTRNTKITKIQNFYKTNQLTK